MTRADTLATQAYHDIRMALFHGHLKPDTFYSENSVALMLGISRTPAREALRQLETEGLIEVLPQRGFRIRHIEPAELIEFYDLRNMLESYVVTILAAGIEERNVRALADIVDRQEQSGSNVAEFISLDEEFHLTMARIARLLRTERIVASLRGVLWLMGTRIVDSPERRQEVLNEHRAILKALGRQDPAAAQAAVVRHITETARVALAQDSVVLTSSRFVD